MSSFYKQQLHPSHFLHSWEVGGPSGGFGDSVFNNYRQLIRPPFCIIDGFFFLNRAKSGCTVTRRTFSHSHLTMRQDVSSHHTLMCQDALFQNNRQKLVEDGRSWRLHRPPSTIRSETGRPVCQFGELGTVPITKRYMLGDWSISLYDGKRAWYARGLDSSNFLDLATRLILCLSASSGTTSIRCIWRCISVLEFL